MYINVWTFLKVQLRVKKKSTWYQVWQVEASGLIGLKTNIWKSFSSLKLFNFSVKQLICCVNAAAEEPFPPANKPTQQVLGLGLYVYAYIRMYEPLWSHQKPSPESWPGCLSGVHSSRPAVCTCEWRCGCDGGLFLPRMVVLHEATYPSWTD